MVTFLAMFAIALPFVISPGASFSLTIGAAAEGDVWSPVKVWAGTSLGIVVIAAVAGLTGLGTFVATNDSARLLFGVIGGFILISFGVVAVVKSFRVPSDPSADPEASRGSLVLWSFLVGISNVKALSLYALVVPSATGIPLTGGALYAAFAGTHIAMLLLWLSLLGVGVRLMPVLTQSPRARRLLVGAAGVMMVLLGVRSMVEALTAV